MATLILACLIAEVICLTIGHRGMERWAMTIEAAIELLKANGYRVSKPRAKAMPTLNAIGKPYSPQYDPNYRMRYRPSMAHLFKPYGRYMQWVQS
jgi:hypothetical protein